VQVWSEHLGVEAARASDIVRDDEVGEHDPQSASWEV
jgi:hypothetical protein